MNIKKISLLLFSISILILPSLAMAAFDYIPMERIPGSPTPLNFCEYLKAVYKFGIWTVGIAGMFMIMFGGYTYLLSAGNNSTMQKGKGFITDAIIGIIMALTAYLLLYIINPDLLEIKIFCS